MLPVQPAYPFPLSKRKERHGVLFAHQSCTREETREGEDSSIKATVTNAHTPGVQWGRRRAHLLCVVDLWRERHAHCYDGDAVALKPPDIPLITSQSSLNS